MYSSQYFTNKFDDMTSPNAEKFECLFLHSVLWGGGSTTTWDHRGDPGGGPRENPRSLSSPKAEKFPF